MIAFAANVLTAYLSDHAFPDSRWSWDTTTTTAGMLALIVAFIFRRKEDCSEVKNENVGQNMEKLMEIFRSGQPVTNDVVQMLLGVSDATATRYLDRLEKEGKIVQIGRDGRFVKYRIK